MSFILHRRDRLGEMQVFKNFRNSDTANQKQMQIIRSSTALIFTTFKFSTSCLPYDSKLGERLTSVWKATFRFE